MPDLRLMVLIDLAYLTYSRRAFLCAIFSASALLRSERQANILMRKENSMRNNFRLRAVLLLGSVLALLPVACSSNSNSSGGNSVLNMAGAWTLTAVSTEGKGTVSGTANVEQSGQGLGSNGSTTLTAVVGGISFSQSGTSLTGTITDSIKGVTYNFTGTLSGDNLTIAGSAPCSVQGTQSVNISGTIASTSTQGNYTITRSSNCYYSGDAGTWTATKQ
jgi:hypothetical protein